MGEWLISGKKELLLASAAKMLKQRSYKDISVIEIVQDSGVNRNTFYYHFKDMPAMVEEIAIRAVDKAMSSANGSVQAKLSALVDMLWENREGILNVFDYGDRETFDRGLANVCEYLAQQLVLSSPKLQSWDDADAGRMLRFIKCSCWGYANEWLCSALDDDSRSWLYEFCAEAEKLYA